LIFLIIVQLGAEDLQKRVGQRHKSEAKDSTTDLTNISRVDDIDNCSLGAKSIGRTDRELGFLDSISGDISGDISGFTDNSIDFTDPTVESTDRTDCTKPTDVRKRYMSDRKGLQHAKFLQLSALPTTQPTSDSQENPLRQPTSNNQETLQETPSQTMSATMFCIPMPLPGTLGSPRFEGANVTEFLERYEDLCFDY